MSGSSLYNLHCNGLLNDTYAAMTLLHKNVDRSDTDRARYHEYRNEVICNIIDIVDLPTSDRDSKISYIGTCIDHLRERTPLA